MRRYIATAWCENDCKSWAPPSSDAPMAGFGARGTVVYKGYWDGRVAAIKVNWQLMHGFAWVVN
jgi:hypothetical protein